MKTVDVVIPVYNSVHWLAWCLEELFRFESVSLRRVFVVDDRSENDQSNKIKEIVARHPKAELILNENREGGFGYACNLGAAKCLSDIILFLNTDCLITEKVIDKLSAVFDTDSKIALACPFSNNSPTVTYPMFPGFSYRDMAELFDRATSSSEEENIIEVCTIVGNCLMIRRNFFESADGFSPEWGIGYGEETDLHMKALSQGLKGVIHIGCYVYHFGGGTFNYDVEVDKYRKRNHQLFMGKWAKEYHNLADRCKEINPTQIINQRLEKFLIDKKKTLELDLLFYLPGINQGVGGINTVITICNDLIKRGLKASCALIGTNIDIQLSNYKEPILFNFINYETDEAFLADRTVLPKVVFSTIFCSASVVAEFAAKRDAVAVQFVQGYEGYFENAIRYVEAVESYRNTDHLVTTSNWLFEMISRHLSVEQDMQRLPLIVNTEIFFSGSSPRPIDIVFIFRSSPDKGQWILAELLDRLTLTDKKITVLCAPEYAPLKAKYGERAQFIDLPIDQYSIAKILRQAKVFIDKSLHEGYGLIPLEAALCGCNLVLSDSGGVRDFVHHHQGELITSFLDSEGIISAIDRSLENFNKRVSSKVQSGAIQSLVNEDFTPDISVLSKQPDAGEIWFNYVRDIVKSRNPPAFSSELVSLPETEPINLPLYSPEPDHPFEPIRIEVVRPVNLPKENVAKRIYKSYVFPYIPQRLHAILKVMISGKV